MTPITLTVIPSCDDDGRRRAGNRGQLFDATLDRTVARSSSTPLCDAARVLLAEGGDPATQIVMRHAGKDYDALRTTIGTAARLTVSDRKGPPAFGPWKPRPLAAVEPPMRDSEVAAVPHRVSEKAPP